MGVIQPFRYEEDENDYYTTSGGFARGYDVRIM